MYLFGFFQTFNVLYIREAEEEIYSQSRKTLDTM